MRSRPTVRIRGHHILCMLGFRGLGYSEDFVRNMQLVVDRVMLDSETVLELADRCDSICRACPRKNGGVCAGSARSLERVDNAVLARLDCPPGTRIRSGDLLRLVALRVSPDDIGVAFCRKCSWRDLGYCADGLAELRKRRGSR